MSLMPFLTFTIIMLLFNPSEVYVTELTRIKWWLISLNGLFALHYNLMIHIKKEHNTIGLTGKSSTLSMAACCTHHIADLVPLAGISVFASLLVSIQTELFLFAMAVNMISIIVLVKDQNRVVFSSSTVTFLLTISYKWYTLLFVMWFGIAFVSS